MLRHLTLRAGATVRRLHTSASARDSALAYSWSRSGELEIESRAVAEKLGRTQISLRYLASALSPLDLTSRAAAAGSSGVAVVHDHGSAVKSVHKGDHVIPAKPQIGTWTEAAVVDENDVVAVPRWLSVERAAALHTGALPAFHALDSLLTPSSSSSKRAKVMLVNGAQSAVAQAAIQLAAARGWRSVAVADDVADIAPVIEGLKYLGAYIAVPCTYAPAKLAELCADVGDAKLIVNLSTDASTLKTLQKLAPKAGARSVTLSDLAKGAGAVSFSQWLAKAKRADVEKLVAGVVSLYEKKKLLTLTQKVSFESLAAVAKLPAMPLRTIVAVTASAAGADVAIDAA